MTVSLVTDSTSDLTSEDAHRFGIRVVPLTVRFGDEQFKDGVELVASAFYERLRSGDHQPSTSQPSPEAFAAVYRQLLVSDDDVVISVHITSKLSGTLQSAHLASQEFGDRRVRVIDSGTASGGLQVLLFATLEDIVAGKSADDIVTALEGRINRTGIYMLLDTLIYLQRGGRIGRARAFLGGMLKVKPLLACHDGEITPVARARNEQQGVDLLFEKVAAVGELEAVAAYHADNSTKLGPLRARLAGAYPELTIRSGEIGPVVGTYVGPGTVGIGYIRAAAPG
ncbi:MAG: DegV family protein [Candidatus Dormibacteria bacterium]